MVGIKLKELYASKETDELVELILAGTLTEQAHEVALDELKCRNVDIKDLPEKPEHLQALVNKELIGYMGFKNNVAQGNVGVIFWLYLVLPACLINLIPRVFSEYHFAIAIWSVIYVGYFTPVLIGLWRSANNRKGTYSLTIFMIVNVVCFLWSLSFLRVLLMGIGAVFLMIK